jgi:pyruvate formate lyase activating enzyme
MKEALYYQKKKDYVQCLLCPHLCKIKDDEVGICGVRKNIKGKLFSLVYGKAISVQIDPIEKKPLFNFLPGSKAFSVGTVGCNLRCKHCQNWQISQVRPDEYPMGDLPPKKIVEAALENNCEVIAYTYNEPTIFYEYMIDTAKLAKKKGIKNIMVSNGFINKEPLAELIKYIDAANIDLKGFTEDFYKKITSSRLGPVLDTIKFLNNKIWLEITNLIIPTLNDDPKKIKEMCQWIVDNVGKDVPLHFSRFFPYYKLGHLPPTQPNSLTNARDIAKKLGIKYVYIGNMYTEDGENTRCSKCNELLVERSGYSIVANNIKANKCQCKEKIAGVWA